MRRSLHALLAIAAIAALLNIAASGALAARVTICGVLQVLTRNAPPESPGSVTIDGRKIVLTSALSGSDRNRVDADVRVGDRVCLTGDLVKAPDELIQEFVLSSCAGRTPPAVCATSLPSTSTSVDVTNATADLEIPTERAASASGVGSDTTAVAAVAALLTLGAVGVLIARHHAIRT